mmetsp:Transcript_107991/g.311257  ORF Transcript_107991/g.311257 Transcript_107991/m.311257 type:complete len:230 (-) Transcript_107991:1639-2328(-)
MAHAAHAFQPGALHMDEVREPGVRTGRPSADAPVLRILGQKHGHLLPGLGGDRGAGGNERPKGAFARGHGGPAARQCSVVHAWHSEAIQGALRGRREHNWLRDAAAEAGSGRTLLGNFDEGIPQTVRHGEHLPRRRHAGRGDCQALQCAVAASRRDKERMPLRLVHGYAHNRVVCLALRYARDARHKEGLHCQYIELVPAAHQVTCADVEAFVCVNGVVGGHLHPDPAF